MIFRNARWVSFCLFSFGVWAQEVPKPMLKEAHPMFEVAAIKSRDPADLSTGVPAKPIEFDELTKAISDLHNHVSVASSHK